MRVEIDPGVANDPDAHRWLDRILYKIEDGWHVWDTTGQVDPNVFKDAAWIRSCEGQGGRVRQMLVASIQRGAWTLEPHGRSVRVTAHPGTPNEFTPENAFRLADEPVCILVENRQSDGAFVKRIVAELDRSLNGVWQKPGEPIRIDSVGGAGQMPDEVERRSRGKPYRPRLIAVIDGDRKGPDDTESDAARKLRRKCEALGVPCWVLAKREAENYLPRILLDERQDAGADHARLVEAWDGLNDDQKDFFDMNNGLPEAPSGIERELFDGLSPVARTTLSRGFGTNVYKCWTIWTVQSRTELLQRGRSDLERGIGLIREEV